MPTDLIHRITPEKIVSFMTFIKLLRLKIM